MSDDQNNPNAMHELTTPKPTESVVRSMPWLDDAERLARQLEQKVFEIDRRRQSIREELERLDALHSWMNARRHEAANIVARMKAASSNGELTDAGPVPPASRETQSRHSVQ